MFATTLDVIDRLRAANPGATITEDRIRHAIRRGDVDPPQLFTNRYAWTDDDVRFLARALGLRTPEGVR